LIYSLRQSEDKDMINLVRHRHDYFDVCPHCGFKIDIVFVGGGVSGSAGAFTHASDICNEKCNKRYLRFTTKWGE